jgi:hypothetical protein
MRKVYDCFTFFNELDLLELRLTECYNHTDYFVIAESNKSFTGNSKPFNLEENWDRFKAFHDKIIYVKVEDMPDGGSAWTREHHQRNALVRGLIDANDNDVIALTDCDELLRPRTLDILRSDNQHGLWICRHPMFYYKFNYLMIKPAAYHVNPMAILKKDLTSLQELRNLMVSWAYRQPYDFNDATVRTIQHSGWHFTYFGDTEQIDKKLLNFSHTEGQRLVGTYNIEDMISKRICWDAGVYYEHIAMDEYFPKTVMNNLERWKEYIVPNANISIKDYVPSLNLDEIYR